MFYEHLLVTAGILISIGVVGIVQNLIHNRISSIRRPLAFALLVLALFGEFQWLNFLWRTFFNGGLNPPFSQAITVGVYFSLGLLLILIPYVDRHEYKAASRNIISLTSQTSSSSKTASSSETSSSSDTVEISLSDLD